jgi:DNA recombination protein RmuC
MSDMLLVLLIMAVAAVVVLQVLLLRRKVAVDPESLRGRFEGVAQGQERTERIVREEIARGREEASDSARGLREEVSRQVKAFNDSVLKQMADIAGIEKQQLETFALALEGMRESSATRLEAMRLTIEERLDKLTDDSGKRLAAARIESAEQSKQMRDETAVALKNFNDSVLRSVAEMAHGQRGQFDSFKTELTKLTDSNEKKLAELRATVESKLSEMQTQNAAKLDEMRQTVDEKLQGTLEKRLGESFKLVSDRLEQVHKGLGEMQTLAGGVGDLKRVLVNVKTRGTWGEMQLGNLLEQVLSPEQYAANVATKKDSNDRVEFAIRLPGREDNEGEVVWLPIDAKFPREDYERLVEASERSNPVAVEEAAKALEARVRAQAKSIREKYIDPPGTTDFAILFLPIEGLYAEVLRRPALVESLQRDCRVSIAGPTTLAALLNSLQMGFRTLAIQKRSSEVWNVLGEVKTQFGKFGEVLDKVKTKLTEASNTIEKVQVRTRAINRKLRDVQELPVSGAAKLPEIPRGDAMESLESTGGDEG